MDITRKSIGIIIDELITTNIKCFMSQEVLMNPDMLDSQKLEAAIRTQELNARRNQLIRALDKLLGDENISATEKTYDKDGKK